MSHKSKLILKVVSSTNAVFPYEIVKSVNTLEYGIPGDNLDRAQVNRILIDNKTKIARGDLTIEFINGRS